MTPRIRSTDPAIRSASVQGGPLSAGHRVSPTTIVNRCAWSPINVTRPCVCLLHIGLRYRYRIIRRLESIPVEKKKSPDLSFSLSLPRERILLVRAHWRGISFPPSFYISIFAHLLLSLIFFLEDYKIINHRFTILKRNLLVESRLGGSPSFCHVDVEWKGRGGERRERDENRKKRGTSAKNNR